MKLYQLFLSTVPQVFISEYHAAYLPGRLIHRSLMLTNEILHKAELDEDFLLLKLDTIKMFDCLSLQFIYALLEFLGFGPNFIQILKATIATTTSTVLIQGCLTDPKVLKRSVCKVAHCHPFCIPWLQTRLV